MRTILIGIAVIISASVIGGLSYWVAGPSGPVLAVVVFFASIIRFAAYLGLFNIQPAVRRLLNWSMIIAIVSILAIWAANGIARQFTSGSIAQTPIAEPVYIYDFSKEKIVSGATLTVKYYKDKTVGVTLPIGNPAYGYTWQLESDVLLVFPLCGGVPQKDGPGKQFFPVCSGNEARMFQVSALEGSGVMIITLDLKKKVAPKEKKKKEREEV
jgi:hypothetical protein